VAPPTPASAPLEERVLRQDERDAYAQVSASAGAEGAQALYYLGLDAAAGGDWKAAGGLWLQDLRRHPSSGWDRLSQFKMAQALERTGDPARAFVQYQGLLSGPVVADLPERARQACQRVIGQLDEGALR